MNPQCDIGEKSVKKKKNRIILLVKIILLVGFGLLTYNFISDFYSGEFRGEGLIWNGVEYESESFRGERGHVIGITPEGRFRLYSMKGDVGFNFIYASAWTTQYRYVRADYDIPKDGEITIVYVYRTKMDSEEFCNAIEQIVNGDGEIFHYMFEDPMDIYRQTKEIWVGYEGCPVATEPIGRIGIVNDEWVFISYEHNNDKNSDDKSTTCKIIDEEYIPILKEYSYTYSNVTGE